MSQHQERVAHEDAKQKLINAGYGDREASDLVEQYKSYGGTGMYSDFNSNSITEAVRRWNGPPKHIKDWGGYWNP